MPRGHVVYDLFASLAAADLLPGHTAADLLRGDRLFTRAEMASMVVAVRSAHAELPGGYRAALEILVREFEPDLRQIGAWPLPAPIAADPGRPALTAGSYKLRAQTDPEALSHVARFAVAGPIGRGAHAVVGGGTHRTADFPVHMGVPDAGYPLIENAYIYAEGRFLNVTLGVQPLRWGPAYSGPLLLGDAPPSIPMIKVDKGFTLPGRLGRQIGRLHFTQFVGQFEEEDIVTAPPTARGTRRHLLARRIETAGDGRWNLSLEEAFKSTRLPDPHFAVILPFYLYQNDWTLLSRTRLLPFLVSNPQPDTFWLNYIASATVTYRADDRGTTVYGVLLLDDVEAPGPLGLGDRVPARIGAQVGLHHPDITGDGRFSARLEYTTLSPTTYRNISPPIQWERDGVPLGFPAGPNLHMLFGRVEGRLTPQLHAAVDGAIQRRRSDDEPGADAEQIGIHASYALSPSTFVGGRIQHRRVTGFGIPGENNTRLELNAGIAF